METRKTNDRKSIRRYLAEQNFLDGFNLREVVTEQETENQIL